MNERIPAYEGNEPYIFISYAHKNSDVVMPVIESLFKDRYRVWYDEGIAPGSEWPKNIEDHLKGAAAVVVFVSEDSLASPNCENEVANCLPQSRKVIQFGTSAGKPSAMQPQSSPTDKPPVGHPKLADCPLVYTSGDLKALLDERLIGDGVTGYDRGIGKARRGNFWTSIIVAAAVLILALGAGIFGLNAGWFDNILPGLQEDGSELQTKPQEVVATGDNILIDAAMQLTKEDLMKEIPFRSEETKDLLYSSTGFYEWGNGRNMTYRDLTGNEAESLMFIGANDELLEYMKYFPKLKEIIFRGGSMTTFEPLTECSGLETVYTDYDVFPVEIPEGASFRVLFMN